jgi:hypothetical protein
MNAMKPSQQKCDHTRCSDSTLACVRSLSTTFIYQHNGTAACRTTLTLPVSKMS